MLLSMGSHRVRYDWSDLAAAAAAATAVFTFFLFSSISLHSSLKETFLSLLAIPWNSAFRWVYRTFFPLPFASTLSPAICKLS